MDGCAGRKCSQPELRGNVSVSYYYPVEYLMLAVFLSLIISVRLLAFEVCCLQYRFMRHLIMDHCRLGVLLHHPPLTLKT